MSQRFGKIGRRLRKQSRSTWPNTLVSQFVLGPVTGLNLVTACTITFIHGPQGSGKTALVNEAITSLGKYAPRYTFFNRLVNCLPGGACLLIVVPS